MITGRTAEFFGVAKRALRVKTIVLNSNDGGNTILDSGRHPLTLKFQSELLEQQFVDSMYHVDTLYARVGLLLAIMMYGIFAILDLWIVPGFVHITWTIRLSVFALFSIVLALSFTRHFRKIHQLVLFTAALVGGGGLVVMIFYIPEAQGYLYYPALVIAFVFFYTLLGLRFINALIANVVVLVLYNVVVLNFKELPVYMLINNNFFLVGAALVIATAGYIIEQQRRISFLKSLMLEKLRRQAEEANVAKSRFFASMSHELRTPLNAIIGYSEMLLEDERASADQPWSRDLTSIETAGRHLLRLINNVLDLAKIESGKVELVPEKIRVKDMVERIESTVLPLAAKNRNRLVVDITHAPESIVQDAMRLEQVLINLLSNACKFTEEGDIALTIHPRDKAVVLSVQDTGIGLSDDQARNLFNEFAQADASISRDYGGTGLGLSISRQLVELMGGTISVSSEPGVGSTFVVTLPQTAR